MNVEDIIRDKLREVMGIAEIHNVNPDEDLREYGMDSLNAIELVVVLEQEFEIQFPEEDLLVDNLCSIQKLAEIVTKLQQENTDWEGERYEYS